MAEDFEAAVEDGLRLSKRIYLGKDRAVAPPRMMTAMDRAAGRNYLPPAPMMYAVISDPAIVDNPDIPSYQPHVHGRCDPPALIPLQMNGVDLKVDCYLDTAFVELKATWRMHCVMGSRCCDCRLAIPMGEQGSILGVEVEVPRKIYSTQVTAESEGDIEKATKMGAGGFLKQNIFILTIPQIDGGTNISVKLRWSQKLTYRDGEFTLSIPFNFPEYVTPAAKKISKHEKIQLEVNMGPGTEVLCKTTSHPLKELQRKAGKLGFSYEADVLTWSSNDFVITYSISSSQTCGGVLLSSPSLLDVDRREMFCCYLFPGSQQNRKVFRKEVIFVVDISGSMEGKPIEDTKSALFAALSKLDPEDLFSVIAFNSETYLFSSSLELAKPEAIDKITEWINLNFIAGGGTNILPPLEQAIGIFSNSRNSVPIIFLITDGSVEDERHICDVMKSQLANRVKISPRIYTLGIGSFCNHYFLWTLATIGRGCHDAAYDADSIEVKIEKLFARASSIFLANISFENLDELDDLEVFPSRILDLSFASPLIVSGRYDGTFPETLKIKGILEDMSQFSLDLKVQAAKEIPLGKMLAKQQIELLTAQAWYSENKELEEKIVKISIQNATVSEYTHMTLVESEKGQKKGESPNWQQQVSSKAESHKTNDSKPRNIIAVQKLGVGFGNLTATAENRPLGAEAKPPDAGEIFVKAASNCCGKLCGHCCCMCCINVCSRLNDQCAIVFTQLCGALACLGCFACCNVCCGGQD